MKARGKISPAEHDGRLKETFLHMRYEPKFHGQAETFCLKKHVCFKNVYGRDVIDCIVHFSHDSVQLSFAIGEHDNTVIDNFRLFLFKYT